MHRHQDQNTFRFQPPSTLLLGCLLVTLVGINACGGQVNATNSVALPSSETEKSTQLSTRQSSSSLTDSPDSKTTAQANPNTSTPATRRTQRVKVFFPPDPKTTDDFTKVKSVWRTTSSPGVAQFALEQLIAGPTSAERKQGLVPAIRLTGNSSCGRDFTLSINNGLARLQFCRQVISAGVGEDARAKSSINATLKQFSPVKQVIILDRNGNCLGDQSGENMCLRK